MRQNLANICYSSKYVYVARIKSKWTNLYKILMFFSRLRKVLRKHCFILRWRRHYFCYVVSKSSVLQGRLGLQLFFFRWLFLALKTLFFHLLVRQKKQQLQNSPKVQKALVLDSSAGNETVEKSHHHLCSRKSGIRKTKNFKFVFVSPKTTVFLSVFGMTSNNQLGKTEWNLTLIFFHWRVS